MSVFRDANNHEWLVRVDVEALKRVKALIGVDLMELGDKESKLFEGLVSNPVLLCDTLFALCKPQAEKDNISDSQFGQAMAGDAITNAVDAFLDAMADFSPAPKRALWKKLIAKMKKVEAEAMKIAEAKMDSPEMDAMIALSLKNFGASSINVPESSASNPKP